MFLQIHLTSNHGGAGPKNKKIYLLSNAMNKTFGEFSTEKVLEFSGSNIVICLDFSSC